AGPRLRPCALLEGNPSPLRRAEFKAARSRVRRRRALGRRLCDPRLGLAPPPPQGVVRRLPQCRPLVRYADGPPCGEARVRGEAALVLYADTPPRSSPRRRGPITPVLIVLHRFRAPSLRSVVSLLLRRMGPRRSLSSGRPLRAGPVGGDDH